MSSNPARPLRLLDVAMLWGAAGGVRRVLDAKRTWVPRLGWTHGVASAGAATPDALDCGGVTVPGSGGYRVIVTPQHARRVIERWQPDAIEVADPYTLAYAALGAAERLQVPAVAYCHAHLPSLMARLAPHGVAARWAERAARAHLVRLYERFDHVLAPSRWVVEDLRACGLRSVVQQPLGVDSGHFSPVRRDLRWRHQWLRALGIDPRDRLLLYTGRFAPEKNLHLLVDAVRRLGRGHTLVAMGSGPCPPAGPQVHVLPPETRTPQLARLLASCDVFVHAGDRETFGLAALEAMACAAPLVTSARCGLGEVARGAGIAVDSRNPAHWAEAIDAQLRHPDARGIAIGLARAHEHQWPRVIAPWLQRYRERIEAARHRSRVAPLPAALPLPAR